MSDIALPTTERLARALEELKDPRLETIIRSARAGRYDDFKSDLPLPQHALVADLLALGHGAFVRRVMDGEFDASMEEAEAWMQSPEGQATFKQMVKGLKD